VIILFTFHTEYQKIYAGKIPVNCTVVQASPTTYKEKDPID
jgi:hypothetical protein